MIQCHLSAIENSILELSKIQYNAGHSVHKGTPRELFIKNFLENHLGKTVSFGSGEIIDSRSQQKESRNQHDIVIYRNEFPRLDFHGGITAFLAESVVATIEVKSNIDFKGLKVAFVSAMRCKNMIRNYFDGLTNLYFPQKILNYIVSYDGPQRVETVYKWIKRLESELEFQYQMMPASKEKRIDICSPGLDGVFILGKGFIHFDNFMIDCVHRNIRADNPSMKWVMVTSETANLLVLFLNLSQIICSYPQKAIQLIPYLKEMNGKIQWGD